DVRAGSEAESDLPILEAALRTACAQEQHLASGETLKPAGVHFAGQKEQRRLVRAGDQRIVDLMRLGEVVDRDSNIRPFDLILVDADRALEVGSDFAWSGIPADRR